MNSASILLEVSITGRMRIDNPCSWIQNKYLKFKYMKQMEVKRRVISYDWKITIGDGKKKNVIRIWRIYLYLLCPFEGIQ